LPAEGRVVEGVEEKYLNLFNPFNSFNLHYKLK
jgi:hypothetical protein